MLARARNTDPETSHLAAAQANASGKVRHQATLCMAMLRMRPGMTAAELARLAGVDGFDRYAANRRLADLRNAGMVENGLPRKCEVLGSVCQTWYPVGVHP